jgi:hypothetical protein
MIKRSIEPSGTDDELLDASRVSFDLSSTAGMRE